MAKNRETGFRALRVRAIAAGTRAGGVALLAVSHHLALAIRALIAAQPHGRATPAAFACGAAMVIALGCGLALLLEGSGLFRKMPIPRPRWT